MNKYKLLDFKAEWCNPCKIQKEIIEDIANTLHDKIEIDIIDIDKNSDIAQKYNIMVIPTLIIEKNNVEIARYEGITSKDEIIKNFK